MITGLMSVNFATSARTSSMPGAVPAAASASGEENWKWQIIANGGGAPFDGTPSMSTT